MQSLTLGASTTYVLARYGQAAYAGPMSIGKNIVTAREAAGIKTQRALTKKLQVEQPQLSDWENDRYFPDTKTLMKIAATIPCSFDALVAGEDAQYDATRRLTFSGAASDEKGLSDGNDGGKENTSAGSHRATPPDHERRTTALNRRVVEAAGMDVAIVDAVEALLGALVARPRAEKQHHKRPRKARKKSA